MRRILLTFLAIFCFSHSAFASFNIQYLSVGPPPQLTGYVTVNGSSNPLHVYIGALNMRAYNPFGNGNIDFTTFCIDLSGVMNGSQYSVSIQNLNTFPVLPGSFAARMAYLYDKYGDGFWNNNATTMTNISAAALQLVIWRLSLGSSGTLSFTMDGPGQNQTDVQSAYTSFWNEINTGAYDNWSGEWLKKDSTGNVGQHVLWRSYPPQDQPPEVPAPGGLVLAAAGGMFLSLTGLRQRFLR